MAYVARRAAIRRAAAREHATRYYRHHFLYFVDATPISAATLPALAPPSARRFCLLMRRCATITPRALRAMRQNICILPAYENYAICFLMFCQHHRCFMIFFFAPCRPCCDVALRCRL